MKHQTNPKIELAGAALLSLAAIIGAASGETPLTAAAVAGLATLLTLSKSRKPQLARVRICSHRKGC